MSDACTCRGWVAIDGGKAELGYVNPSCAVHGRKPEPWLGHRDLCSVQWSEYCDCDPEVPVDLSDATEEPQGGSDG